VGYWFDSNNPERGILDSQIRIQLKKAISGNRDFLLYSPDPVDGSRTGKLDSNGFILEIDYLPFGGHRKFFSPKDPCSAQFITSSMVLIHITTGLERRLRQ
jgi:hypothetical protein